MISNYMYWQENAFKTQTVAEWGNSDVWQFNKTEPFHSIYKMIICAIQKNINIIMLNQKYNRVMMETLKRQKLQRSKYLEKIVNTLKFLSN